MVPRHQVLVKNCYYFLLIDLPQVYLGPLAQVHQGFLAFLFLYLTCIKKYMFDDFIFVVLELVHCSLW
jgi:hypothetical protein